MSERMTERDDEPGPHLGRASRADKAARRERVAEEMRANLKKRKAQRRAREEGGEAAAPAPPPARRET